MSQPIKSSIDYEKNFSNELRMVLDSIIDMHKYISPEISITPYVFLDYTLSNQDCMLYKALNGFLSSYDITKIQEEYNKKVLENANTTVSGIAREEREPNNDMINLLVKANDERARLNHRAVTSDHVLLAMIGDIQKFPEFRAKGLTKERYEELCMKLHNITDKIVEKKEESIPQRNIEVKIIGGNADPNQVSSILNAMGYGNMMQNNQKSSDTGEIQYCINLNKTVKDKIIGRDEEIDKIIKILGRKKKNNAVLVGESGVGKTSVIYGLVNMIRENTCPSFLKDKTIFRLNPMDLMAGTTLRGMFEDRINGLINAFKKNPNYILFIDDFHNALGDKQKSEFDFVGSMNDVLNGGDVNVIASTTDEGYKNGFEKTEFGNKFQKIIIEEPSEDETREIIAGILPDYEAFHKVKYTKEATDACISLARRYVSERRLPSSAIDILDEAGSEKKISMMEPEYIKDKKEKIKTLEKEHTNAVASDNMNLANSIKNDIEGLRILIADYIDTAEKNSVLGTVEIDDIYKAVSEHTNVPVSKLNTSEKKSLSNINDVLKRSVIGQDEAIDEISRAIKRNKVGLFPSNKPIGSFMLIGNTGVGKTLTAKNLASEIFGNEKYLVRFDMSEYSDRTSVNKLIGASAGYVGYDRGGLLTEAVKKNKYCVLLIDEIEKADEEIYNIFLQILDEGFLTDNVGYKVDFKNTIILFTSNVGTKQASLSRGLGFEINENENKKEIIEKELKKKFPPEFINRLDDVIYFRNLSEDNIKSIIVLELEKLRRRVESLGHSYSYNEDVINNIYGQYEKEKEYGARPIMRIIQNDIENQITDLILENDSENISFESIIDDNRIKVVIL